MIIEFSIYDWFSEVSSQSLNILKTTPSQVERIILYAQEEFYHEFYEFINTPINNITLQEYTEQYNIPIDVIIGTRKECVPHNYKNINIIEWPTYWFPRTYVGLNRAPLTQNQRTIFVQSRDNTIFKYPCICLLGKPSYYRIILRQALYDNNLLDKCAYSWNPRNYTGDDDFKNEWPSKSLTDIIMPTGKMNIFIPPQEYFESFIQLVSETTADYEDISEKTVIPLLLKNHSLRFRTQDIMPD